MKKFMRKILVLALLVIVSGKAGAQTDLGGILGGVLKGVTGGNTSTGDLVSSLTSVFSGDKQASENNIVGTWEYSEPAILFESDNILAKAGASLAANKIEDKIKSQLERYGIKEGLMKITFSDDGTFVETLGKKEIKGKWTVVDSKLNLTFGQSLYTKGKTIPITTQLEGSKMMVVTDATKILDLFKNLSNQSSNSTLKTVASLMKTVNGMKAGITLVKKQ